MDKQRRANGSGSDRSTTIVAVSRIGIDAMKAETE
jgi:hypothetical protein